MASRSTRRRLKNPEMPKLEGCQNEEETHEENQTTIGRRRSLRHSPGTSSLSPPHKTRRIKDSPSASESKVIKSTLSPTKSSKSSVKSYRQEIKELKDAESTQDMPNETIATRKSTRNSPVALNSSPVRMTRNNSLPSHSPIKKSTSKISNVIEAASSPRRNTRSKASSPCEKESEGEQSLKDDTIIKSKKGRIGVSSNIPDKNSIHIPSTSVACKRSLLPSPEPPVVAKNGSSIKSSSPKRKRIHQSPERQLHPTTNGKASEVTLKELNKTSDKESVDSDAISSTLLSNCSIPLLSAFDSGLTQPNGKSSDNIKISLNKHIQDEKVDEYKKRRLSDDGSDTNENINKRSKCEEVLSPSTGSTSVLCSEKQQANAQTITIINSRSNELLKPNIATNSGSSSTGTKIEKMDTYTCAESLLLKEFALTESQCNEVCSVLSSDIKDSSNVVIVEELVKKLLKESTSILSMSSPRFNKLLRQLLIKYCNFDTSVEKKHFLCESALEWSKERKSVNLRHELELALMTLYYNTGCYRKAEEMATGLYKETKKLQDKEKTVKACLCLSKAYHAMGNISKARANITTAKTEALKIYTPPDLQGELDLQSGIMQVAEEKDMETAFSYFKEAATGFTVRANRSRSLKYMLLTKLLLNRPDDGEKAVRSQCHVEDIDEGVEAMLTITKAAVSCSLADFKKARQQYGKELEDDLVVSGVLDQLYGKMLEKNLLNIIAPYERMQISVVAEKIGLGREEVERRLSQMILDGQISAQLDHRDDCLYVYQGEEKDGVYEHAVDSISQFDRTLSLLNRRIKQLL